MKHKIIINGKAKEYKSRDLDHLDGVLKYRASVTTDKKKVIPRKQKHKEQLVRQY